MCDRVGVMYAGELVEQGPAQEIFDQPRHPYTVGLLRCIPRRGQRRDHGRLDTIPGFLPAPGSVSAGCVFEPRCALADQRCRDEAPPLYPISTGQTRIDGTSTDGSSTGRASRCHYHEKAPSLPRATPEDVHLPGPDLTSAPSSRCAMCRRLSPTATRASRLSWELTSTCTAARRSALSVSLAAAEDHAGARAPRPHGG
jgi:peptide/nickel transport system ATP-binding protein